jgi:hypothetical protein
MVKAARAHDGASTAGVKSKIGAHASQKCRLGSTTHVRAVWLAGTIAAAPASPGEEGPLRNEGHEHTEGGLNSQTVRSIAPVFQKPDRLKPLSINQLTSDFLTRFPSVRTKRTEEQPRRPRIGRSYAILSIQRYAFAIRSQESHA